MSLRSGIKDASMARLPRHYFQQGEQMAKPNIILIFVDNQPAKMLGCAGNPEIHTPHLDALASRGTRFSEPFLRS